jgi:long-chain acyl-CoA synthetase
MGPAAEFSTITEMLFNITTKFAETQRPMLLHKVDGKYKGMSYAEVRSKVADFALGLAALGVKRYDNIGLLSENRPEWVIADFGMVCLGAVNVPLYPTLTVKQIEFIFKDVGVKLAIVSNQSQLDKVLKVFDNVKSIQKVVVMTQIEENNGERVITFSEIMTIGKNFGKQHSDYLSIEIKKTKPDDLLTIIYTSGTTGNPKGVMLTHKNLVSNMKASAACIPFTPDDILLSFLPLCHSYERMAGYYTAISCGASIAYAESIETVRENILEVRPTVITTVPRLFERIYNRLMKQVESASPLRQKIFYWALDIGKKYALAEKHGSIRSLLSLQYAIADKLVFQKIRQSTVGRLKFFVSGAAALGSELAIFFEAIGIKIIEGYGMTESSPVISVNRVDDYKFGTVGKPIPGVEVKIADDGEILVRGSNVMKGYWNNRQATEEAIDSHCWLHTGDMGMFDPQGFLVITDRKKHLFISSGGKNIAPQPIENLFLQSRFIDQFVLIGDRRMFLTALIVPDFNAIQEYAAGRKLFYRSVEELAQRQEIYELLEEEINKIQKNLANYERVRKFVILNKPLSIENSEITPTMKVRRKIVEEKFKYLIERMYHGIS